MRATRPAGIKAGTEVPETSWSGEVILLLKVTYSPDGRWWWNGAAWVPIAPVPTVARPTAWTLPLQQAAAGLLVIGLLYSAFAVPASFASASANPFLTPADPSMTAAQQEQFRQIMRSMLLGTGIVAAVLGVAWNVVLLVGSLRRWRWVFWYLMIVYLLGAALNLVTAPITILSATTAPAGFGVFPRLPWWLYLAGFLLVSLQLALGIWMLVALRRFGTWACVRTPVTSSPAA